MRVRLLGGGRAGRPVCWFAASGRGLRKVNNEVGGHQGRVRWEIGGVALAASSVTPTDRGNSAMTPF